MKKILTSEDFSPRLNADPADFFCSLSKMQHSVPIQQHCGLRVLNLLSRFLYNPSSHVYKATSISGQGSGDCVEAKQAGTGWHRSQPGGLVPAASI